VASKVGMTVDLSLRVALLVRVRAAVRFHGPILPQRRCPMVSCAGGGCAGSNAGRKEN
jgi:hypothetical protein